MPFTCSYAKSLIALALDENKVIDVPDEEELDDDDDDDDEDEDADEVAVAKNGSGNGAAAAATSSTSKSNKEKSDEMEADSTAKAPLAATPVLDDEKPSTSNGDASGDDIADVDNDAVSTTWKLISFRNKYVFWVLQMQSNWFELNLGIVANNECPDASSKNRMWDLVAKHKKRCICSLTNLIF